ncbi:RNA methyltransferase, TrmA family [Lachnospiraceae bacterium KM106-2]|nr:RNA methyltransferase, TrmA family [Lachnospiraceae bacterium KM106-2]
MRQEQYKSNKDNKNNKKKAYQPKWNDVKASDYKRGSENRKDEKRNDGKRNDERRRDERRRDESRKGDRRKDDRNKDDRRFSSKRRPEKSKKVLADGACPFSDRCGGCHYQEVSYKEQLQIKQNQLKELLGEYGKLEPIIGMENPTHYRNKIHSTFHRKKDGTIISGVYEEGSHHLVAVENCMIEDKRADSIIKDIRDLLKSFKILIYNEDSGYGLFRHVLIRTGYHSGEIMVVLVMASPIFPGKNNFVKALRKLHPEITTIVMNINDKNTSMILGDRQTTLYGKGYIEDTLCGKKFRISPKSFYQVNPVQTEILYQKAIDFAFLRGNEVVLDAYCGIGTIGLIASDYAKQVISVELNKDAVRDAISNAKLNGVKNTRFYNNDAGKFMLGMAETNEKVDVVFMDPPRAGSDENFLSSVVKLAPKKVVYISCNPHTLARDLEYLTFNGYEVEKMQGVDMFPYTSHVETVVLLSQLKADHHIEVDLNLDELDATSAETKATYNEIQQYVLKETGLMVSNLYIAQVKKKCGIEVGESFNKPKSENAKQPKCPTEKEKAIRDALVHFGMI